MSDDKLYITWPLVLALPSVHTTVASQMGKCADLTYCLLVWVFELIMTSGTEIPLMSCMALGQTSHSFEQSSPKDCLPRRLSRNILVFHYCQHEDSGLNNTKFLSYSSGGQKYEMDLPGLKSSQAEPFPCLFQVLDAAHVPCLMAPPSIFKARNFEVAKSSSHCHLSASPFSVFLFHFKGLCNYTGLPGWPRIIAPSQGHLINNHNSTAT